MKRFYASETLRQADHLAEETCSVPGLVLMENAGRGAAEIILRGYPNAKNILVLCGPGNNGGDGFVAARHLSAAGRAPQILATSKLCAYKNDAAAAMNSAAGCKLPIFESHALGDEEIVEMRDASDLVIDALLGTGSVGAPRGEVARLLLLCGGAPDVVSLDIPSGVNPDTGETADVAATASLTVTFLAAKPGLAVAPGALRSGRVEVCGLGVSPDLILSDKPVLTGYDQADIAALSPVVAKDAHKGDKGSLLILGGSDRYRGAPILAAMGALRAGCGVVTLAIPDFAVTAASSLLPEAIFESMASSEGSFNFEGIQERFEALANLCDAAVLGPGLGRGECARKIVDLFWRRWSKPLLVDADALYHLSSIASDGDFPRREDAVITPHAGEAARLLNKPCEQVANVRLTACRELASRFSAALLKGPNTLVSDGDEDRVILEGSPALAVAGSGDVLSGMIGAFLSVGMRPIDAATLAALLHGKVGTDAQGEGKALLAREIALRSNGGGC